MFVVPVDGAEKCVDNDTVVVVDNAITVLDIALKKKIVDDEIEMMSSVTDEIEMMSAVTDLEKSFDSKSSHSSQIKDEVVEQMPLDSLNHPNSRVKKKRAIVELDVDNKNVKILTDREIEMNKFFLVI